MFYFNPLKSESDCSSFSLNSSPKFGLKWFPPASACTPDLIHLSHAHAHSRVQVNLWIDEISAAFEPALDDVFETLLPTFFEFVDDAVRIIHAEIHFRSLQHRLGSLPRLMNELVRKMA